MKIFNGLIYSIIFFHIVFGSLPPLKFAEMPGSYRVIKSEENDKHYQIYDQNGTQLGQSIIKKSATSEKFNLSIIPKNDITPKEFINLYIAACYLLITFEKDIIESVLNSPAILNFKKQENNNKTIYEFYSSNNNPVGQIIIEKGKIPYHHGTAPLFDIWQLFALPQILAHINNLPFEPTAKQQEPYSIFSKIENTRDKILKKVVPFDSIMEHLENLEYSLTILHAAL